MALQENTADDSGWYADPKVPGQSRWWDGTEWTIYTKVVADARTGTVERRFAPHTVRDGVDETTALREPIPLVTAPVTGATPVQSPASEAPVPVILVRNYRRTQLVALLIAGAVAVLALAATVIIATAILSRLGGL